MFFAPWSFSSPELSINRLSTFNLSIPNQILPFFSACGGILFSFGSVLMWAFLKNVLPNNNSLATFAGLTSGLLLVRVSVDYMNDVDKANEVD